MVAHRPLIVPIAGVTPAGWLIARSGRVLRWWDGHAWTQHVAGPAEDPPPPTAPRVDVTEAIPALRPTRRLPLI